MIRIIVASAFNLFCAYTSDVSARYLYKNLMAVRNNVWLFNHGKMGNMVKFLVPAVLLVAVLTGAGFFLFQQNQTKSPFPSPSAELTPSVTPSPTPTFTPTPTPKPTPKPTIKPTPKPTAAAPAPASAGGSYSCTLFIGYSQTNNWFPAFHSAKGQNVEMLWVGGGAAGNWVDPGYEGWSQSIAFPCVQNKDTPDRLVLDVTHYAYLNQEPADMAGIIRSWISLAKSKYPSARAVVIQPVTGGPGGSICQFNGKDVRASVNHPIILAAIDQVAASGLAGKGNTSRVSNCSQYADDIGHLNGEGQSVVGAQNANFYK